MFAAAGRKDFAGAVYELKVIGMSVNELRSVPESSINLAVKLIAESRKG